MSSGATAILWLGQHHRGGDRLGVFGTLAVGDHSIITWYRSYSVVMTEMFNAGPYVGLS